MFNFHFHPSFLIAIPTPTLLFWYWVVLILAVVIISWLLSARASAVRMKRVKKLLDETQIHDDQRQRDNERRSMLPSYRVEHYPQRKRTQYQVIEHTAKFGSYRLKSFGTMEAARAYIRTLPINEPAPRPKGRYASVPPVTKEPPMMIKRGGFINGDTGF